MTGKNLDIKLSPTLLPATSPLFPSPLMPYQNFLAWSLAFLCSFSFYLGPILLSLPPLLYPFCPQTSVKLLFLNALLVFYPHKPWPLFRKIFQLLYEPFELHHNVTPETSSIIEGRNDLLITAMHPHGIIPIHAFIWAAFNDQYFPSAYGVGSSTDAAQYLPVLRQLLSWLSAGSADRKVLERRMKEEGENLFILPGGVAEIFLSKRFDPQRDRKKSEQQQQQQQESHPSTKGFTHVIKGKRYGLMKLALQTGALLTPVYVFGGSEFFDQLAAPSTNQSCEHSIDDDPRSSNSSSKKSIQNQLGYWLERLSRRIQGGLTFYWGQYGTPLPYKARLTLVLGDPIIPVPGTEGTETTGHGKRRCCRKIPNPTDEQVQDLMERYVESLRDLFDTYKGMAGYEYDTIEII